MHQIPTPPSALNAILTFSGPQKAAILDPLTSSQRIAEAIRGAPAVRQQCTAPDAVRGITPHAVHVRNRNLGYYLPSTGFFGEVIVADPCAWLVAASDGWSCSIIPAKWFI